MDNTTFLNNAIKNIDDIRLLPNKTEYNTEEERQEKIKELRQIAKKRIKAMTESFDLKLFYEQPYNYMCVIIVTPNQVAIVYGDGIIIHDYLLPIFTELINNKKTTNPNIIIRLSYKKDEDFSLCVPEKIGKKRAISRKMNEFVEAFYNKLKKINIEDANEFDQARKESLKFNDIIYSIQNRMGINNFQADKEIIGVELNKYINKQKEELEL